MGRLAFAVLLLSLELVGRASASNADGGLEGKAAIIRLYPAKKDVAVNQVWRACHLCAILIETLAREALGRQIRQSLGTC